MNRWKLAQALDPRWSEGRDPLRHVVHVPIDLLSPPVQQLDSYAPLLTEMQRFLFGFADKPIPRRQESTIWRNVYIYMLYESGDMTVPQIVEAVFPGHDVDSRNPRIYQILGSVRRALKKQERLASPTSS